MLRVDARFIGQVSIGEKVMYSAAQDYQNQLNTQAPSSALPTLTECQKDLSCYLDKLSNQVEGLSNYLGAIRGGAPADGAKENHPEPIADGYISGFKSQLNRMHLLIVQLESIRNKLGATL